MKVIPIHGTDFIFDDSFHCPHALVAIKGYAYICVYIGKIHGATKRKFIAAHRLIAGASEGEIVDHINGNPMDNRSANLRITDAAGNSMNKKNVAGCSWNKKAKKWQAQIVFHRKTIYLGLYAKRNDAVAARNAKAAELSPMFGVASP